MIRTHAARPSAVTALAVGATGLVAGLVHARPETQPQAVLDVQPFPGTPDASPSTDVGFPALRPSQIAAVSVRASRTGFHRGRLIALPAGHGTAFIPLRPFAGGDRVSVLASLSSPTAGTESGAPNATELRFSFTVAAPVALATAAPARAASIGHAAQDANGYTHTFHSENWLHPPAVWVSGQDPDSGAGDVFADAEDALQPGPMILDPNGRLVYFQPLRQPSDAFNVEVQQYQGQSVLTYWQGYFEYGIGIGRDVILDHHYQQVAVVRAGHGYHADVHEFQITPQGDALITAYAPVRADLTSIGGSRYGTLLDSIIQEIDIATGQVLWEWHASGHVRLNQTYWIKPGSRGSNPYDFFHVNSIQQLPNGNLLVSARHTWALYEINMKNGRISLVIGGKHSFFKIGRGAQFEWQHDASIQADGTLTVFDNASDGITNNERQSRALRLRVNLKARRVTLVRAYTNKPSLLSGSQGSVQILPDGKVFVGWGAQPYFTEFAAGGRQLWSLHFDPGPESYRGLRFPWWGQPLTPPSVSASAGPNGTHVYASWNGATTVASWRVLAGPSPATLTASGEFPKNNFETAMWVYNTQPYIAVQALDASGNALATSAAVAR